jgi:hypothetical protein
MPSCAQHGSCRTQRLSASFACYRVLRGAKPRRVPNRSHWCTCSGGSKLLIVNDVNIGWRLSLDLCRSKHEQQSAWRLFSDSSGLTSASWFRGTTSLGRPFLVTGTPIPFGPGRGTRPSLTIITSIRYMIHEMVIPLHLLRSRVCFSRDQNKVGRVKA